MITRLCILTLCITLAGATANGQSGSDSDNSVTATTVEQETFLQSRKLQVHVEFGTSFTSFSGYGSTLGTYVAPEVSYLFSPRFRLSTGLRVYQPFGIQGSDSHLNHSAFFYPGSYPLSLMYAKGAYRLNENVTLSGTAFREINLMHTYSSMPGNKTCNDYQGIIMGLEYKLGNNFFIHGEVGFSKGISTYGMPYIPLGNPPGNYSPRNTFHP